MGVAKMIRRRHLVKNPVGIVFGVVDTGERVSFPLALGAGETAIDFLAGEGRGLPRRPGIKRPLLKLVQ